VLNSVPNLTWTIALLQLFLGLFYVFPIWSLGVRKTPVLNSQEIVDLLPMALAHTLTHVGAVVSLGAGAVSFTHIVKAAEPAGKHNLSIIHTFIYYITSYFIVSAGLSALFLRSFLPWQVSLSLVPVMGGVVIASMTELSFSWTSFIAAMVSNVASASRGIIGKINMGKSQGQNMDATNLYAVMTVLSTAMLLPVSLALEWQNIVPTLQKMSMTGKLNTLMIETFLSAFFYYSYNEVAFLTLDQVAPVTHALGNTIKRVVIILTSVIVFGTTMTTQGAIGSAIAIGGVLLYSLAKNKFK
jgi:solute carrier family 35 protein E1